MYSSTVCGLCCPAPIVTVGSGRHIAPGGELLDRVGHGPLGHLEGAGKFHRGPFTAKPGKVIEDPELSHGQVMGQDTLEPGPEVRIRRVGGESGF